jgi:hypothetical protein
MKFNHIFEQSDPHPTKEETPDHISAHSLALMQHYQVAADFLNSMVKGGILRLVVSSTGPWIRFDQFIQGYGVKNIPENNKYIVKIQKALDIQTRVMATYRKAPVSKQMDTHAVAKQLDFIQTRIHEINSEVIDICAQNEFDDGGGHDPVGEFVLNRNDLGKHWMVVYSYGDDEYYVRKSSLKEPIVKRVIEFGEQIKMLSSKYSELCNENPSTS